MRQKCHEFYTLQLNIITCIWYAYRYHIYIFYTHSPLPQISKKPITTRSSIDITISRKQSANWMQILTNHISFPNGTIPTWLSVAYYIAWWKHVLQDAAYVQHYSRHNIVTIVVPCPQWKERVVSGAYSARLHGMTTYGMCLSAVLTVSCPSLLHAGPTVIKALVVDTWQYSTNAATAGHSTDEFTCGLVLRVSGAAMNRLHRHTCFTLNLTTPNKLTFAVLLYGHFRFGISATTTQQVTSTYILGVGVTFAMLCP